jgi:hypothetical protein
MYIVEVGMGTYSVPEEIRAMKPKGTIVKRIKNQYYVYTHSQSKDRQTGKWRTDPGKLIGKIIPGVGYCPNADSSASQGITCFDYGQYRLACRLCAKDFSNLKLCLNPDEAMIVFCLAIIIATEGCLGLKAAASLFERSLMARDYPALKFSYHRVSKLLELIGRQGKADEFARICMDEASDKLAIDGHAIPSTSENNDLAAAGHKTKSIKSEYMNLMVVLDVAGKEPVGTKVFPGYMPDKSDFLDFMEGIGSIAGKILLIDKGFFSDDNLSYITSHGGSYVIPVAENMVSHKQAVANRKGRMSQFIYHAGKRADAVEYRENAKGDGITIHYFRNLSEAERLSAVYLKNLEQGKKGYSQEGYQKQRPGFGVIVLQTNLPGAAKEIYDLYKARWSIEVFYDRLKNGIDFEELNLDDWAVVQGLSFIMLLAGRIDAGILKAAKNVGMTRKELLQLMSFLKLTDDGTRTCIHNMKKQHIEVAKTIGLTFDLTEKCLD